MTLPEYHTHEEFINRSTKLAEIRALGINPYPAQYIPTNTAAALAAAYNEAPVGHSEEAAAGTTESVCVAGRLILFRSMGKNAFAQIQERLGPDPDHVQPRPHRS